MVQEREGVIVKCLQQTLIKFLSLSERGGHLEMTLNDTVISRERGPGVFGPQTGVQGSQSPPGSYG